MFILICQYCDYKWKVDYINKYSLHCEICNDDNIREISTKDKIDYYAGSPPFPKKELELDIDYFGM